ncbi:MAG TPA: hypothetical protein VEC37_20045, partial [Bacillota bacterium]|nr:hypothetical protein [Bacillota bacterium]
MARLDVVKDRLITVKNCLAKIDVKIWLWVATAVLLFISWLIRPDYTQPANLLRLFRQAVPFGFIAIGQTLAILTGRTDL